MSLLFLTGCQSPASSQAEDAAASAVSALSIESVSAEEAASDETDSDVMDELLAAAEQGQPVVAEQYTVEDGVLYYGGAAVTEERTTFDLRDSDITDYSFLKDYSWVVQLLIEDEALVDLDFLQYCTNLRYLSLSCGASDFQAIGTLPQLSGLDLDSPYLTDLDFLSQLNLYSFGCVCSDSLTDISGLQDMVSLQMLSLFCCTAIDDFSALSSLSGLEQLILSGTRFDDLTLLSPLSSLTTLVIEECPVDYADLAASSYTLTKLQSDADADTVAWLQELFPDCEFVT